MQVDNSACLETICRPAAARGLTCLLVVFGSAVLALCNPWLIGLAGAGQPENNNVTRDDVDPCTVLDKDDIAATLGAPVAEVKHEKFPIPKCRYSLGLDRGAILVYVVFADSNALSGLNRGTHMRAAHISVQLGIGDDAHWMPGVNTLNVLKAGVCVSVTFLLIRSVPAQAVRALGQKVAGRMS